MMGRIGSTRRWLGAAVSAVLLVPAPHAFSARRPEIPVVTLGKTTVVTATRHSHALLEVPEDVSLGEMTSWVSGGGRVAGFVLTNRTQDPQRDDFLVYSFTFNRCRRAGCADAEDPFLVRWSSGLTNNVVPAGTYDLYVIADRATVSITFKDPYLEGTSRVRLEGHPFDVDLRTLPMSPTTTSDGTVFSGGDFTSLEPGEGLGLLGLWALGSPYAAGAFGSCFYFSDVLVVDEDAAFLPGCPTASSASRWPAVPARTGEGGFIYQSTYQDLPLGIGGWATSASRLRTFGAVGLWLRFDE